MFLWAACGVPFGAYSIIQNFNVPIQVQPQCFMGLCLVSWAQVLVYGRGWRAWTAALLGVAVAGACAGIEAALILTLRVSAVLMSYSFEKKKEKKGQRRRNYKDVSILFMMLYRVSSVQSKIRVVADNKNSQFTVQVMRRQCWSWV